MAYSKITIAFTEVPEVDQEIYIIETLHGLNILEHFKAFRNASNQTKIPKLISGSYSGFISENYKNAINLDANATNTLIIQWTNGAAGTGIGTVVITANYSNAFFELDLNTTTATITVENEGAVDPFVVSEFGYSQAASVPCQNVTVSVETSALATKIIAPPSLATVSNTDNPITFDWLRGQSFDLVLEDEDENQVTQAISTPSLLNAANFTLVINNSPNGATVIVNNTNSEGLTLEYSLDNTTWQSENVFSGLDVDEYTLYIRDNYGCSATKTFSISDVNIYIPYFHYSKSNPIRMAKRVVWDDYENAKNDENTLSCEEGALSNHTELQQSLSTDISNIQFKSNYATNSVNVIKPDGSTDSMTVVKKSSNIGVKDKRDAIKFEYADGKTGIYFMSGNLYDYDTEAEGDAYALNGFLPYWATAGNYVSIGTSWFQIEQTIFDENRNVEAIIINSIYTGVDTPIIVGSIFNFEEFEIYECAIDWSAYLNMRVQVEILATDTNFGNIRYLSEIQEIKLKHPKAVQIRYWNEDNTDVYYGTNIKFALRQMLTKKSGIPEQKHDNLKTDTNVFLLNGEVYEVDEFIFEPMTKGMMLTIVRVLSHEFLFIDNVGYVKNDSVDTEQKDDSNLYVVKAKMIKSGASYTSQVPGISSSIYNGEGLEFPGLVNYGGGFVKL